MVLRVAFLCALLAFGLAPQTADAHSEIAVPSPVMHSQAIDGHAETSSLIEEVLEHCHPGLDCAVSAIVGEPVREGVAVEFAREKFRLRHARHAGVNLSYEPPPPRHFV